MKTITTKKEYLSQKEALEDLDICFNLLTTSSASFIEQESIAKKEEKYFFIKNEILSKQEFLLIDFFNLISRFRLGIKDLHSYFYLETEKRCLYIPFYNRQYAYSTTDLFEKKGNKRFSQRTPALCFKDSGGEGFYVDDTGYIFPLDSRYTAPVLVVEGNIPVYVEPGYKGMAKLDKERKWINDILAMTKYIGDSGEWKDSIRRIYVGDNGDIMLKMKQGDEKFILGQPEGYEAKLDKIHSYYDYIVPSVGENHYKIVNLKYNQQIVCRQKDTLQRQISVVPR